MTGPAPVQACCEDRPVDGLDGLAGAGLVPLEGGFSGETFLAEAAGERAVVRVYAGRGARRGHDAVLVDAAVLSLVRDLVPVPRVLEVRRPTEDQPAVLVTSYLPGARLDLLIQELDDDRLGHVGAGLGSLLATLATIPMRRTGLFTGDDLVIEPFDTDLVDWVEAHDLGWAASELAGLRTVAARAQDLLDLVDRTCLVHSDLNAKNLLVDPDSLAVTGVLDWEFAHAGHPFTDLGNLLRFDREPTFVDAVLAAYTAGTPTAPANPLDLARAADLLALVDLASRRGENPVTERADELLRAIARTGDLHASP